MTRVVSSLERSVKNLEVPTLRGHMPGNEISASGAEGGGREWWEVRSGQQGPQRQDRHITCHSNFEDKRGCINNYAQITRDTG